MTHEQRMGTRTHANPLLFIILFCFKVVIYVTFYWIIPFLYLRSICICVVLRCAICALCVVHCDIRRFISVVLEKDIEYAAEMRYLR